MLPRTPQAVTSAPLTSASSVLSLLDNLLTQLVREARSKSFPYYNSQSPSRGVSNFNSPSPSSAASLLPSHRRPETRSLNQHHRSPGVGSLLLQDESASAFNSSTWLLFTLLLFLLFTFSTDESRLEDIARELLQVLSLVLHIWFQPFDDNFFLFSLFCDLCRNFSRSQKLLQL